MNTHKEQDRFFWAKLNRCLAVIVSAAGAAQKEIDEYPLCPTTGVSSCRTGSVPATSVSSCRTSAPAATPPPLVTPAGAGEFSLTLTAAQLVALSRAVENELLPFVRHVYEDDSSTYRTTLIKVFQAIRAAECALPTGPRAIHIAPLTPATEPHALRVEGYDPEFTPNPENFGQLS